MSAAPKLNIPEYSRYRTTRFYQDGASGQLYYAPWTPVEFPPALDDQWVSINEYEGMRLDLIAAREYGRSDLWWVVARANDIFDPFTQLYGYPQKARSPVIFSADGRECFYAIARQLGSNYNTDSVTGLTFKTSATTLEVYVTEVLKETFVGLSPYPINEDGTTNRNFWGSVGSAWIEINWIAVDTLRPEISGIEAPAPRDTSSYLTGGVDERKIYLRLPSLQNITTILDNAAL
jgi:hypothetical protein